MRFLPLRFLAVDGGKELWSTDGDQPPGDNHELWLETPDGPLLVRVVKIRHLYQPNDAASNMHALVSGSGYKADLAGWDIYVKPVDLLD
jgi:hypothetical protein